MNINSAYIPCLDDIEIKNKSLEKASRSTLDSNSVMSIWTLNERSPLKKDNQENGSIKKDKWFINLFQIIIPFLIAGMGMVCAGVLLNQVQNWNLYKNVTVIIVLVPALLGLKGNLEMTLAARLSTQVNLGEVDDSASVKRAVLGNLALTQVQSIVIGFMASLVACLTQFIKTGELQAYNLSIIIGTSITSASIASLLLGGIVMFIIIISKKLNLNPDNIATPIASSLGDLVTLAILSGIGTIFYMTRDKYWIHILIILVFFMLLPILIIYSRRNYFIKEALTQGWLPIIIAMLISSFSGVILDFAIKIYKPIAIYQPVINGVGGNIVSVYASRLSTALHKTATIGHFAPWAPRNFLHYIIDAFIGKSNPEYKVALILISCIIPGHLLFFFIIYMIQPTDEKPELNFILVFFYLLFSFTQVMCLILICYSLVHLIWRLNKNPDNFCIPLLTSSGDLLGILLLFVCFHLVYLTGNTSVGNHTSLQTLNHKSNHSFALFPLDLNKLRKYL